MPHPITRVRHDIVHRHVMVEAVTRITPAMIRVRLAGPELAGFTSLAADDHIKLFLTDTDGQTVTRDYTPRRFHPAAPALDIDFAIHDTGPATRWAQSARPGDVLHIAGPRGSQVINHDFAWWLLIGDESALPAIARRVEDLAPDTPVTTLVAVTAVTEEQTIVTRARHQALWVHRPAERTSDPAPLLAALDQWQRPATGDGFIWIAGEALVVRAIRDLVRTQWEHPPAWTKASGYWIKGQSNAHQKFED